MEWRIQDLRAKLGGPFFYPHSVYHVETNVQSRWAAFCCRAKVDLEKVEGMSLILWKYLLEMHNIFEVFLWQTKWSRHYLPNLEFLLAYSSHSVRMGRRWLWWHSQYLLYYFFFCFPCSQKQRDEEMPKNNTTTNDSSHQPGKNRVPIASDADGNEKPGKSARPFFNFYALNIVILYCNWNRSVCMT